MNKKTCFLLALILVFTVVAVIPGQAEAAAKKAKYKYVTYDKSRKFKEGSFENYFKYPKVQGKSRVAKAINAKFEKEAATHVQSGQEAIEVYGEELDYSPYTYFNTAAGNVSFNKKGVFSYHYVSTWGFGGTGSEDDRGLTFSLKSGKKLNITNVVAKKYKSSKKLKKAIANKLTKKYGSGVASEFKNTYKTSAALKKLTFYINKSGKVVVCFPKYDISYGAMGCLTVTLPSRF